jgi:hypothetical protein
MRRIVPYALAWLTAYATPQAYETPVHLGITMALAEMAGFSNAEAFEMAKFDQATDDDPATDPLPSLAVNARRDFHFVTFSRLGELRMAAQKCRATPDAAEFKAIGQYLHAFEDTYSHRGWGPLAGHAIALHTPDKPWTEPNAFRDMFVQKWGELLLIRRTCIRRAVDIDALTARFSRAVKAVETWVIAETQAGLGDPSLSSEARWEALRHELFGSDFDRYAKGAVRDYDGWVQSQRLGPWRRK